MKPKSLFIGFITGTAIAGAATLFTAPVAGKDLRDRVKKNKAEIATTIQELKIRVMDIKADTIVASQVSKDSFKAFAEEVKILIEGWKQDIEPNKEELIKNIKKIETTMQELEVNTESTSPNLEEHDERSNQ